MTLKIHYASGSPWAWRVMLGLAYKGLAFEAQEIHFSKGDSQTPEFLVLNPHGQVPVLQDGDFTLYESSAILVYLDRKYPENPLFGSSAEDNGLIWQRLLEMQNHLFPVLRGAVLPIMTGTYDENKDAVHTEYSKVPAELAKLEIWLGDKDYFFSDGISAIDITLYPMLALMQRLLASPPAEVLDSSVILPLANKYPKLAAWMQRIEAMPRFDEVYPTHWQ